MDTGVDRTHPALHDRWRGLNHPVSECWMDALGGSQAGPTDTHGHGTHTMGTMCGREFLNNGDTLTVGAAPDAEWIACNAINQGVGSPFDQDVLDAYQWFADPDGNVNTTEDLPDVIQNSWGVTSTMPGYTACFATWNTAITNCEAAGPVVTWSAGNEGPSGTTCVRRRRSSFPRRTSSRWARPIFPRSIAPYPIAGFSSRGPSGCAPNTNAIKPEISAPGVSVYSAQPGGGYRSWTARPWRVRTSPALWR